MFTINTPEFCQNEISYILDVLLGDYLGITFNKTVTNVDKIRIEAENKALEISLNFFHLIKKHGWLHKNTLPNTSNSEVKIRDYFQDSVELPTPLPIFYGKNCIHVSKSIIRIEIDILGTCFFMLSRYEEAVIEKRDEHDRFRASYTTANSHEVLNRPIVNEYLELLWAAINYLWPNTPRKQHAYKINVTCDVDIPYSIGINNFTHQLKQISADIFLRKSPTRAISNILNYIYGQAGNYNFDPYYKMFDWMMSANESAGNVMIFYFQSSKTDPKYDGAYNIREKIIRRLLKDIDNRGHIIGIHPSYNTYTDPAKLKIEVNLLSQILEEEGIKQEVKHSRQHYLRWHALETARNLEKTGICFDSTLAYPDQIGFRCGTCLPFKMFDLSGRQALGLFQIPLHAMEATLNNSKYMNIKFGSNFDEKINQVKESVKRHNGVYTLLWHNSNLDTSLSRQSYLNAI